MINKKIIYLILFLILTLFLIIACQKYRGERIIQKSNDNNNVGIIKINKDYSNTENDNSNVLKKCLPINDKSKFQDWACENFYTKEQCKKFQEIINNVNLYDFSKNIYNPLNINKINLIFLGYGYQNEAFLKNKIPDLLGINQESSYGSFNQGGLFTIEPFNNYKERFNIYYASPVETKDVADGLMINIRKKFDNKYIIFIQLFNQPFGSQIFGRSAVTNPTEGIIYMDLPENFEINGEKAIDESSKESPFSLTFTHEFGHAFALLEDEYISQQGFYEPNTGMTLGPSCDIAKSDKACSNWCVGKPKDVEGLKSINCNVEGDIKTACTNKINSGLPCAFLGESTPIGGYGVEKNCINFFKYCTDQKTKSDCENKNHGFTCVWDGGSDANNFQPILDSYYKSYCIPRQSNVDIGSNCLEGTGCYQSCHYFNTYRSSKNSLMSGGSNEFNKYSKDVIIQCFKDINEKKLY